MGQYNLNRIFKPRQVAVVGASEKAGTIGNALMRNGVPMSAPTSPMPWLILLAISSPWDCICFRLERINCTSLHSPFIAHRAGSALRDWVCHPWNSSFNQPFFGVAR